VARSSEHARSDVLVEVADQPPDHESHLPDGLLHAELRFRPLRPKREEHIAALSGKRVRRPRQEQTCGRDRVRRIRDDRVERAQKARRQRLAEIVLKSRDRKRRAPELAPDEIDDLGVDVQNAEVRNGRPGSEAPHHAIDRKRRQVVVSEEQDATADQRVGLVDRQYSPQLRLHRAVALVEVDPDRGRALRQPVDRCDERRRLTVESDSAATACRTGRGALKPEPTVREQLAAA
jgi:hypothetical protein